MKRVSVTLASIAVVLTSISAAPVPTHLFPKEPVLYFPTTVGTTWVYKDDDDELTLVVSSVEQTNDGKVVAVVRVTGDGLSEDEKMLVSAGGLARVQSRERKIDPPLVMLKVPYKPGDTWTYSKLKCTDTIRGIETIKVPAGIFDTVRVDSKYDVEGQDGGTSFWYAPGVGLVKMTYGGGKTQVLKSFTRGKE